MKNKVLALGYFDAIHKGHQHLIKRADYLARQINSTLLICTFGDDFYANLGKESKEVFTLKERRQIFSTLGYDDLYIFDTSKAFFNKSKADFLHDLMSLSPAAIVVGRDYRFGKNASGDITDLQDFFGKKNVPVEVVELLYENDNKISTTLIKQLLAKGDIVGVNTLLGFEYFISGKVKKGRQLGATLGIPTANIDIDKHKLPPKAGVFVSKIAVLGEEYFGITNIGAHPTFADDNFNVETHIFDFYEDIYGKQIDIKLVKFIREIICFENKGELIEQISADIRYAREELK